MVPAVEQEDCGGSAYIVPQYGNDAAIFYTEVLEGWNAVSKAKRREDFGGKLRKCHVKSIM
jgi:hypothetical protein